MKTKDDLLEEMKKARGEYNHLSFRLDFTDITDEEKIEIKQSKTKLKELYADLKRQRDELIRQDFFKNTNQQRAEP